MRRWKSVYVCVWCVSVCAVCVCAVCVCAVCCVCCVCVLCVVCVWCVCALCAVCVMCVCVLCAVWCVCVMCAVCVWLTVCDTETSTVRLSSPNRIVAAQKRMAVNKVTFISNQNGRKSEFPNKFDWKSPIFIFFFSKLSICLGRDRRTDSVSGWAFIFNIGVFFDATPFSSAQTDQYSRVKLPFFTFRVTD